MTSPPILASFHYFRRVDMAGLGDVDLFADSGAFSAYTSGAVITVADYVAWLRNHSSAINFAAALDVIGDHVATRRNADRMRDALAGDVAVLPTFHVGSPWSALEDMAREYRFIALGGAVAFNLNTGAMMPWLVKAHRILADHGAVAHGFGLTKPPYPELLPWYSTDSSYWTSASRTGSISLWDGRKFAKFRVGTPRARAHMDIIRRYGGDPERAATRGFGIIGQAGPRGAAESQWLRIATAVSFWRYADHIRTRRPAVSPPPGVIGDGAKIYLAAGGRSDITRLIAAWRLYTQLREGVAA